jgi:hypothetical protein
MTSAAWAGHKKRPKKKQPRLPKAAIKKQNYHTPPAWQSIQRRFAKPVGITTA